MGNGHISQSSSRLVGLDIFRIVAAFVVFLFHSEMHIGCWYGVFNDFVSMGAIFMTAFFMLSGFVLFFTYRKKSLTHIAEIKNFYIKKLVSILPLYYVTALLYIILLGSETLKQNLLLAPIEILGIQSVFTSVFSYSHNGGTWFVSCLILCYLLYPYMQQITIQIRNSTKFLLLGICVFILLWSPFIQLIFRTGSIYSNPFFRILEFFIGMLLCSIYQSYEAQKGMRFLGSWPIAIGSATLLVVGVTVASKCGIPEDYMLYSWVGLPMFLILLLSLAGIPFQAKARPVTDYLCKISYAFFFAQFFTWTLTKKLLAILGVENNIFKFFSSLAICLLLTIAFYELLEKPLKKWLTRLLLSKRRRSDQS